MRRTGASLCLFLIALSACGPDGQQHLLERLAEPVSANPGCYVVSGATGFPEGIVDLYLPEAFRLRPPRQSVDGHIFSYPVEFLSVPENYRPFNRIGEARSIRPDSLLVVWDGVVQRFQIQQDGALTGTVTLTRPEIEVLGEVEARLVVCPTEQAPLAPQGPFPGGG